MHLDKEPSIMVRQPDATMQPTPQDNQLLSKHRVLSFKPQLRFEWRGQDGQNETEQPDHSASLVDSITSSTRIRFSVHTASKIRFGARHAFTANCSSSGLRSRSRALPSTWSNDGCRPARDGEPSCVTTRRTLPPWTCSLFQLSVSTCSMPSSSSGSTAESWSGSTFYSKSDGRMGCTSNNGGITLG